MRSPPSLSSLSRWAKLSRGRLVALALALCASVGVASLAWLNYQLYLPGARTDSRTLIILRGMSFFQIARMLEREEVASSSFYVVGARIWGMLNGRRLSIKAGEYKIAPKASIMDVLRQMDSGRVYLHKITIPEGLSSAQIVQIIRDAPFLQGGIDSIPAEGSLLPETWRVPRGTSRAKVIALLQRKQAELLARLWREKSPFIPFSSPDEAVILASIVEKETSLDKERGRVASVFLNRLQKRMRLEADSTVIYGITLGEKPLDRALTRKDLRRKTPFNTYVIHGLPPTPIANPGVKSLEAVFNPPYSEELFFVADGTGGHRFSTTLEEHNRNVRAWRAIRDRARAGNASRGARGLSP